MQDESKYRTINNSELDNTETKNKIRIQKKSKRTITTNLDIF